MAEPTRRTGIESERPPRPRRPRWGVRTVWLVALAFACMWLSDVLSTAGVGALAGLASLGAWVGLVSAAYCSYRGVRGASWLPR
jgi:hypothetical protein